MDDLKSQDIKKVAFKSKSSILSSLAYYSNLWKTKKWTDCVLVGNDGVRVPAHMVMLAAHSPFLGHLLKFPRASEEICLIIPSLPGSVIEDIVGIMYGKIAVDLWGPGGKLILEAAQLLGCHYIEGLEQSEDDIEGLDQSEDEQEPPELVEGDFAMRNIPGANLPLLDLDLAEHLFREDGDDWDLFDEHLENATNQEIKETDFKLIDDESNVEEKFCLLPDELFCSAQPERSSVIVSTSKIKPTLCILEEKQSKASSISTQNTYLSPKEPYIEDKCGNEVVKTGKVEMSSRRDDMTSRRVYSRRKQDPSRRDIQLPGLPPDSHQSAINEITILCSEHIQPRRRRLLRLALTCVGCHQVFMSGSQLEDHVEAEHGKDGDNMFRCVLHCSLTFSSFSLLCHHSAVVHKLNLARLDGQLNAGQGADKKEFKCRLCGEKFMYGRGLQRHFRFDHDGELPFECGFCGHQTSEISRYNRHLVCHQVARQREYCDICFKEFRNKVSLKTHRNMVHKLGKKYPCSHCDKILYSSQYLKKHEATHAGIRFREVICKYCGKSIEYSKIKNHELTHTGEKPFQCPECNYRCIQRSNLRIHMKGVHGTELPRLALGQKRYSGKFMDGTAGNTDPFDLRSIFHNKTL